MGSSKPTVLFVHGSWHQPCHFQKCIEVFEKAGYPTSCPPLPSSGQLPPIGYGEDVQCVRDELHRLVFDQGRDVIVVAHSYGGHVTTGAVEEAFSKKSRSANGEAGGVLHLVYMSAMMLPMGVSPLEAFGAVLEPHLDVDDRGTCIINEPGKMLYHDLPVHEQEHWSAKLLRSPAITHAAPTTHCAYKYHPVTFLHCENDAAIPYQGQRQMVKDISESYKIKIHTQTCQASHSPYLSMPGRVLEVVDNLTY